MLAAGIAPKLRSFTPALVAYAEQGNCDKAFEGGSLSQRHTKSLVSLHPACPIACCSADMVWGYMR